MSNQLLQSQHEKEDSTLSTMERDTKKGEMSSPVHSESSADSGELHFEAGEILTSATCQYMVTELLGEGCFGKVLQCQNVYTLEKVAIKVLKQDEVTDTEREVSMLETIGVLDPDRSNLVRFLESFNYMGHTCLAFEQLDIDLFNLLELGDSPMCVFEIRDIAEQLLVAVDALKGLGVVHGDIKPDNVMLVDAEESLRVKLVDFGLAVPTCEVVTGMAVQAIGFRAPEVCLGLPFDEAVDMWGVGCVLAFLFLRGNLISSESHYQTMKSIVQILDQPPDSLLSEGMYTGCFFTEEDANVHGRRWRLMTPEEFSEENDMPAEEAELRFHLPGGLDDLMEIYPIWDNIEWEERAALVDLLKGLLHVDPARRLTPCEALQHPFITRSYLDQYLLNKEPYN